MRRIAIVPRVSSLSPRRSVILLLLASAALFSAPVRAQSSSSTADPSAQGQDQGADTINPENRPRAARIEEGGAAVTLEISEPLFDVAAALNACGYDADLDKSAGVRAEVRADMNAALAQSEPARASRDALCAYVLQHRLSDSGLNVGQYVSLSLYLSPPPELTPNVDETQMPPQALGVVNILPLLRTFIADIDLHVIWLRHREEYEALVARVHEPMVQTILATNIYLHQPVSSYDGRRFLVLLEPMLSPRLANARVYGSDYIIVVAPDNTAGVPVRIDQIRHVYLDYVVDPMVYSRGPAMTRIQPLLRGVQDAPLEFSYKSDAAALIAKCLIKAIEARMYEIAGPKPEKPRGVKDRAAMADYTAEKDIYDRTTALERQKLVDFDEREGWVLTDYFYKGLQIMERNGDGLRDEIAPMIYGMDVDGERRHAEQIVFVKDATVDPLKPVAPPRHMSSMDIAERDLLQGKTDDAADLAEKVMAEPQGEHDRAQYVLARVDLMRGDPEKATDGFEATLRLSHDPRTLAWSHIYLGRLYDTQGESGRPRALAEYKAALANRDSRPDTKAAAEAGLKAPFALPLRSGAPASNSQPALTDDKDFDPTGKAEKDAYKPAPPK